MRGIGTMTVVHVICGAIDKDGLYDYGPIWLWSIKVIAYIVMAYIVMAEPATRTAHCSAEADATRHATEATSKEGRGAMVVCDLADACRASFICVRGSW